LPLPEAPSKGKVYQRRWREAPMAEKKLRFKVMLEGKEGSSVAWLNAPFGTRARIAVRGTINGFPFRSSLMPVGGCHGMAVNKTMRQGRRRRRETS
jgi:hypothetical protein